MLWYKSMMHCSNLSTDFTINFVNCFAVFVTTALAQQSLLLSSEFSKSK